MVTFANYNKGNASISDIQSAWEKGQLPNNVKEYFKDNIEDVCIRSLVQADYNLFTHSLIVDNIITVDDFTIIIAKDNNEWQIAFYKQEEIPPNTGRTMLSHQEIAFVEKDENLLKALKDLISEYSSKERN